MAIYKLLREGDEGQEVEKLQQALIDRNYDVGPTKADGIYGKNTAQAVRNYQTANNLTVDGIAGDETLGMLYGTPLSTPTADQSTVGADAHIGPLSNTALTDLTAHLATKPQQPDSIWEDYMTNYADQYFNREKFSYDVNEDALYQQLQDQYTAQGRLAMLDTMAQAQAMNGGYGSSYAQSVGQQAYNGYMQSLADQIPQLYQLARSNYDAEGQSLLDKLSLAAQMDDREYSRYTDALSRWLTERGYLRDVYETERSYDYAVSQDSYGKLLDLMAVGYEPTDEDLAAAGMTRAQADAFLAAYGANNTGYTGSSYENGDNGDYDEAIVRQAQAFVGTDTDGKWGPNSAQKAKNKGYNTLEDVVMAMYVQEEYRSKKKNGATARELDSFLKEAIADGLINTRDADELRHGRN